MARKNTTARKATKRTVKPVAKAVAKAHGRTIAKRTPLKPTVLQAVKAGEVAKAPGTIRVKHTGKAGAAKMVKNAVVRAQYHADPQKVRDRKAAEYRRNTVRKLTEEMTPTAVRRVTKLLVGKQVRKTDKAVELLVAAANDGAVTPRMVRQAV